MAQTWSDRLKIKAPSIDTPILSLSGGNQQKVLFARALASDAKVIFLDDPLRGVDVHTKQEVYKMIRSEAENGRAVSSRIQAVLRYKAIALIGSFQACADNAPVAAVIVQHVLNEQSPMRPKERTETEVDYAGPKAASIIEKLCRPCPGPTKRGKRESRGANL